MVNEIIRPEYRDMFGINPKYWSNIENKLNDADCMRDFTFLVNYALKSIVKPDGWNNFYSKKNDGYWYCKGITTKGLYNFTEIRITGSRMMRFVRAGIMTVRKNTSISSNDNRYFFVDDFFTTNDVSVKFAITDITL